MLKTSNKVIFFFLLFTFLSTLIRTSNVSAAQFSEEEVHVAKIGDEECDDELTYNFQEIISHEIENIGFEDKNACTINRIISSNYLEPHLENLSYPPERTV